MRHSSFAGSDSRRINASPRLSTRAVAATNGCEASRSTLPVLSQPPYTRSASPNVTKRTGWTTPRTSADATAEVDLPAAAEDNDAHEEDETADGTNFGNVDEYAETAIKTIQAKSFAGTVTVDLDVIPMENAVEILEAIAQENESRRQTAQQRTRLLERAESQRINEVNEHEPQQLAYLEHMYSTVQLLHSNLEKERTRTGSCKVSSSVSNNSGDTLAHQAMLSDLGSRPHVAMPVKSPKRVDVSTKLLQSPLRIRLSNAPANAPTATFPAHTNAQSELQSLLHHNADLRIRNKAIQRHGLAEKDLEASTDEVAGDKLISSREQKLRDTLNEKVYWQHEYECMRDQVVEEKSHQVELFRRLESAKRHHFQRTDELERALRECHVEIELLRAQLTETQVRVVQQRKRMEEQAKHTKEEKEKLVCSIAETRHKFKDWKEGEVGTLKAARDQAVHNLKTEYELKIARHHEEKQKLRDKVKDLEVSLRLLQRDRNLSAVELSLRKATILGSKEASTTTEAELIEANSRIKELEALLNHTKEYQKRQEHIIKVSESTIARLMQEWEVVALENLTLQPMAALTLPKVSDPTDSTHLNRFSVSLHSGALAVPTVGISIPHAKASVEMDDNANPRSSSFGVHHHVARENVESPPSKGRASQKVGSSADMVLHPLSTMASTMRTSSDPEKEILRRQSIVLSAEVEKYRQIVVHSLDEIRTLKDSKRRSHHGMLVGGPNGNATNLKEQYLFSEVLKLQAELDAMKEMQKKHAKKKKKKHPDTINKFGGEPKEASESDNDLGSSSSSSSSESSSSDRDDDDSKSDGDAEQDEEHAIDDIVDTPLETLVRAQNGEAESIAEHEDDSDSGGAADTKAEVALVSVATNKSVSVAPTAEALIDHVPAYIPEVALEVPPAVETFSKDTALKVIQSKSKTFIIRRAFLKKKVAIDKIKAQYRGYLVRKNVELLDRHHQKQFIVTQAMQYKMQIVAPHHEMTCKCHGLTFKLVLRVSKDPPIVLVQMQGVEDESRNASNPLARFDQPMHDELDERVRAVYFHLFEIIELLPLEEEASILEKASETEIAKTFAALLSVVRIGGQYKFSLHRKKASAFEHRMQLSHLPGSSGHTPLLNELYVESMIDGDPSRRRGNRETREKHAADDAKELEDLIRNTRIPLADDTLQIDFNEIEANIATRADHVHLKKMLRRMSSSAPTGLDIIPGSPRSMGSKFL